MNTRSRLRPALAPIACAAALALAACSKPEPPVAAVPATAAAPAVPAVKSQPAAEHTDSVAAGIAWRHAATDVDVDAAFADARAANKPVFLYWGAKWCPPCNQVKATLFNRQDFIERSRAFVPVYVDGDVPGAQKIGSRFRVSGYPTMVLFNAQGEETTRLPGEVEPGRYREVLDLGMNSGRPVKALVADALAGKSLRADDWRLLAWYSWDTDAPPAAATAASNAKDATAATLAKLAAACPPEQADTALRLQLKSLAAADAKAAPAGADVRARVLAMLGDAAASRAQADMVTNYAADIAKALAPAKSAERAQAAAAFEGALTRLQADTTLSRADRMQALVSRVDLVRIDEPEAAPAGGKPAVKTAGKPAVKPAPTPIAAPLLADIREQAARADREITDGYERQAVITAAAYLLERAGLGGESDSLLEANLAKSHSPYYLMSGLAGNAKKRGDTDAALRWYGKAYESSEGPATRLQWGASYVAALIELTPADEAGIERAVAQVIGEAAAQSDSDQGRSARSMERIGARLARWNEGGRHAEAMKRLQAKVDAACAAQPAGDAKRASCSVMLKPAPGRAA